MQFTPSCAALRDPAYQSYLKILQINPFQKHFSAKYCIGVPFSEDFYAAPTGVKWQYFEAVRVEFCALQDLNSNVLA